MSAILTGSAVSPTWMWLVGLQVYIVLCFQVQPHEMEAVPQMAGERVKLTEDEVWQNMAYFGRVEAV